MVRDFRYLACGTPWLTPDWRWRRASQIVERKGYATIKRDGELVQRAVRCIRRLQRVLTDRGVRRTAKEYADVYWALRLKQETSLRVLELKARVLAGQSDYLIAKLLGLPTRTVETFVAMFFDVRSHLKAGTWIRFAVIGLQPAQSPSVESLLLLHAWRRGPTIIEPWLDYLVHQEEHHDLSTDIGLQRAWIEQLVRVQQLPLDSECLRSLWKLSYFTLGKPPKTVESATINTAVLRNRAEMLSEIAWNDSNTGGESGFGVFAAGDFDPEKGEKRGFAKAG